MSKSGLETVIGGLIGLGYGVLTKASALATGLYTLGGAYLANIVYQYYSK